MFAVWITLLVQIVAFIMIMIGLSFGISNYLEISKRKVFAVGEKWLNIAFSIDVFMLKILKLRKYFVE